ncbi:hypothetical protein fugu_012340 [Takifugu bimaculatus]|uniref:TNFR-Cys domain-containing protein n=1 Tax=Takifugu bimaculatus TaxID=433685 RepID=A0A4Z2C4U3_9TELE|nr:hypothetical protein fugu_012340 [Takifugu bimaculatus]
MEAGSNVSSGWIKTLILCYVAVSLGFVVPSSSQCVDGTYKHDGRDCCLCAAGLYLMEHCTETLQYGKCEACKDDTYSNNLEEDEPCTPARNRKCRCRKDHYCSSKLEICRLCNPCKVELYPHLPDIADIIGWKDMKDIAIASGITQVTIE